MAVTAVQLVVASTAADRVVAAIAEDRVIAVEGQDDVIPMRALDVGPSGHTDDRHDPAVARQLKGS
jgi:hypothetical protein